MPDSLPPQSELFAALRRFHDEAAAANLAALNIADKNKWMRYMPSVGIGYNLQGEPRPIANFSLSQITAASEQKEIRAAERQKILRGAMIQFKVDSFDLIALLEKHRIFKISLLHLEAVDAVELKRFEIEKRRYTEGGLTDSQWLDIQAAHMRTAENLFRREEEIGLLEIEILKLAKY
jgi:hypothetical protein